jgi:hypothetical protein
MILLRKELVLLALLIISACALRPEVKSHLSSEQVEALMEQGVVALFQASRDGSAIVLDDGKVFSVELPATNKIDDYLQRRRQLGKSGSFEIE